MWLPTCHFQSISKISLTYKLVLFLRGGCNSSCQLKVQEPLWSLSCIQADHGALEKGGPGVSHTGKDAVLSLPELFKV